MGAIRRRQSDRPAADAGVGQGGGGGMTIGSSPPPPPGAARDAAQHSTGDIMAPDRIGRVQAWRRHLPVIPSPTGHDARASDDF